MYAKFVGITQEAAEVIERRRLRPDESESDIIERELGGRGTPAAAPHSSSPLPSGELDFGQGIRLRQGQELHLFLSKSDADRGQVAARGTVVRDGVEVGGQLFRKHRGSYLQRPMQFVQEKLNHRGADGKLVSLNAYLRWHVEQDGKLLPLDALKDDKKRRRRRSSLPHLELSLEDLGLAGTSSDVTAP